MTALLVVPLMLWGVVVLVPAVIAVLDGQRAVRRRLGAQPSAPAASVR